MRNKVIRNLTFIAALAMGQLAASQPHGADVATNSDIQEMLTLGIPEDVIVDFIRETAEYSYSLDPAAENALRDAGATEVTLQALRAKIRPHMADTRPRIAVDTTASGSGGYWPGNLFGALKLGRGAGPLENDVETQFEKQCAEARYEPDRPKADYTMMLERKGGKGLFRKVNRFAVYTEDGALVYSGATRTLSAAIRDACGFVMVDQLVEAEEP